MVAIPKISALFETSLATAMSTAATTFTVVSGTDRDGTALSGLYGFIIDEGTADEEFCTGTISSTTVTISKRGCDADAPETEVAANKKAHRRGASVKITDYPIMAYLRNALNGETGYELPTHLRYASNTSFTDNEDVISKRYADALAIAGAPDSSDTVKGLVEQATLAEIEAAATSGGTSAPLFVAASRLGARLYYGYAADAGGTDAYAITLSPVPTAYTTGMVIVFKANTINTGAATINVNSLGVKDIRRNNGLVLANGDIQASQFNTIVYNGTYFELQSPIGKPQVSTTGEEIYGADAGASDTYAITVAPVPSAYVTGQVFRFKANTVNTGPATLNVNALGAKSILRPDSSALADGDIAANQLIAVIYDGTNFLMLSPVANSPKYTHGVTTKVLTDASTTQNIAHGLGRVPRYVRFEGSVGAASGNTLSIGTYNGSTYSTIVMGVNNAADISATSTAFVIQLYSKAVNGANYQTATVSFDATNIILTWTKTGSPTETGLIRWEAEA